MLKCAWQFLFGPGDFAGALFEFVGGLVMVALPAFVVAFLIGYAFFRLIGGVKW